MGWPTASEIGIATRITLTATEGVYTTSYGFNVSEMLTEVIADIAAYCRRPFGFDKQTLTQTYDGGRYMLMVSNPPIISVTSLTDNYTDEVLDPDTDPPEYWVYDRYVRIPRPTPGRIQVKDRTPQLYDMIYVGGYDDDGTPLPADVKEVCAEMCARTLLRVDQQYRVYQNVEQFVDGEAESVFPNKEKFFADQYAKLARNGRVMTVTR